MLHIPDLERSVPSDTANTGWLNDILFHFRRIIMIRIKLLIVVLVFGLAGFVYASSPSTQDQHANHGKASCCAAGAACCDGGTCCSANKDHQDCSTAKDADSCCKPGADCCNGGSCCSNKSNGKQADSKPAKQTRKQTTMNAESCCSGGSCCTGGSCCAKHKS